MKSGLDLSRSELEALIDEWILNERNRRIMKRRMIDGVIYEDLADEFGLSTRHIKTIVYRCKEKLFAKAHKRETNWPQSSR